MTGSLAAKSLRDAGVLTAITAAAWAVAAGLAFAFSGPRGLEAVTWAAAVCLIPGWLVFALQGQYGTAAPLAALLFGVLGRMAVVLSAALAVKAVRPELEMKSFGLWLGAFYVLTLAVETKLLLTPPRRGTSDDPHR